MKWKGGLLIVKRARRNRQINRWGQREGDRDTVRQTDRRRGGGETWLSSSDNGNPLAWPTKCLVVISVEGLFVFNFRGCPSHLLLSPYFFLFRLITATKGRTWHWPHQLLRCTTSPLFWSDSLSRINSGEWL